MYELPVLLITYNIHCVISGLIRLAMFGTTSSPISFFVNWLMTGEVIDLRTISIHQIVWDPLFPKQQFICVERFRSPTPSKNHHKCFFPATCAEKLTYVNTEISFFWEMLHHLLCNMPSYRGSQKSSLGHAFWQLDSRFDS